jgi:hypothetical protein
VEYGTNDVDIWALDFDDTSVEYAQWGGVLPSDYDGGTMTAVFYWRADSASGNSVVWGIQGIAYADSDPLDTAWGDPQEIIDANNAQNDNNQSAATAAMTLAGSPAAGQKVQFRAYRDPTDGSDDLVGDARLSEIRVTFTRM